MYVPRFLPERIYNIIALLIIVSLSGKKENDHCWDL